MWLCPGTAAACATILFQQKHSHPLSMDWCKCSSETVQRSCCYKPGCRNVPRGHFLPFWLRKTLNVLPFVVILLDGIHWSPLTIHSLPCLSSHRWQYFAVPLSGLCVKKQQNMFLFVICCRWKRDRSGNKVAHPVTGKNILQFVAIKRRDCGEWAIPGVRAKLQRQLTFPCW